MTTPAVVAWTATADDRSDQFFIRISTTAATQIETLRTTTLPADPAALRQQSTALQQALPMVPTLSTWVLDGLPSQELVSRLRQERDEARRERDEARQECDEHMTGEGRLQQRLANAELIMDRLARSAPAAAEPHVPRAERIADPDKFDGSREKLKTFKDQLMLKTSGNAARFPNTQHKLRYAYQFLTGKAQRTMRIHLRRSTEDSGEETDDIVFESFAAFLAALDRHFGDPDEKHTAALALDKLRQANREFGAYYAD